MQAVRFETAKKGYNFEQVEVFVSQVKESLAYYEDSVYKKDLDLHETRQEILELQDRILELQATIEVFRAKGDPLVRGDGSYVTESQLAGEENKKLIESLQKRVQELEKELLESQTQLKETEAKLIAIGTQEAVPNDEPSADYEEVLRQLELDLDAIRSENKALLQQINIFAKERDEAVEAEEEMRSYVEETLASWLAEQTRQESHSSPQDELVEEMETVQISNIASLEESSYKEEDQNHILIPPKGVPFDLPSPSPELTSETVSPPEGDTHEGEPPNMALESPVTASKEESSDWGEDMPALGEMEPESSGFDENMNVTQVEEEEEEEHNTSAKTRTNIILSAPELGDMSISIDELPVPSGTPIPGLPDPPKRKKASITNAPELQVSDEKE